MCAATPVEWEKIRQILARNENIVAAWVFGSARSGFVQPGSDLDLGILFDTLPTLDELATLSADLQEALQIEEIDLSILNRASPVLRFEAISGRPVFCRNVSKRATFASLTAREYEDEMAFARRGLEAWKAG